MDMRSVRIPFPTIMRSISFLGTSSPLYATTMRAHLPAASVSFSYLTLWSFHSGNIGILQILCPAALTLMESSFIPFVE